MSETKKVAPPCENCRFLLAHAEYTGDVTPVCVAYQMQRDFSCFEEKGEGREV